MECIPSPFCFSLPLSQNPPQDSTVDNRCQLVEAVCNMKPAYSCWESMTLLTAKAVYGNRDLCELAREKLELT